MSRLSKIQQELKAPKGQVNKFGGYRYRSVEDIIEAVKPLLGDCVLTCSDEVVQTGNRIYVRATATFREGDVSTSVTAYARECQSRKGMDEAQITGACSSYARKYALGGLFLCDDQKDPDSMQPHNGPQTQAPAEPTPWDGPATPPQADARSPESPPSQSQEQGHIAAPNPDQRKWYSMLMEFYQTQAPGQALDKMKLVKLANLHIARHPSSMHDVEQLKNWIKVNELV